MLFRSGALKRQRLSPAIVIAHEFAVIRHETDDGRTRVVLLERFDEAIDLLIDVRHVPVVPRAGALEHVR